MIFDTLISGDDGSCGNGEGQYQRAGCQQDGWFCKGDASLQGNRQKRLMAIS